jgi:hypothetical protein
MAIATSRVRAREIAMPRRSCAFLAPYHRPIAKTTQKIATKKTTVGNQPLTKLKSR